MTIVRQAMLQLPEWSWSGDAVGMDGEKECLCAVPREDSCVLGMLSQSSQGSFTTASLMECVSIDGMLDTNMCSLYYH